MEELQASMSHREWAVVIDALSKEPYRVVASVLQKLLGQISGRKEPPPESAEKSA